MHRALLKVLTEMYRLNLNRSDLDALILAHPVLQGSGTNIEHWHMPTLQALHTVLYCKRMDAEAEKANGESKTENALSVSGV